MLLDIIYIIGGLLLLLGGGHFLVNAGVSAASKYKIAPFIIGATVVAFGTSAPELIVSVDAALSGHPAMVLGNVVGSNIANIALVLGATACIITLPVISKRLFKDWLLVVFASILVFVFAYNNSIGPLEGSLFLVILLLFIYSAIKSPKEESEDEAHIYSKWGIIILAFVGSGAALAVGADLLVNGASNIARMFNISERIIAITIVAFGTSLPELATSVVAALKKQTDISIGNIIGSNLFNILAVLGISSLITPIEINYGNFQYDLIMMLGVAILLFMLIYPYRHNMSNCKKSRSLKGLTLLTAGKLNYKGGIILLISYFTYMYFLFARSPHITS